MTSRRERLLTVPQLVVIVIALLAAIAAAATVATTLPRALRAASPDVPVTAYLGALSRGDVPAALKLGQIAPAGGTSLLSADAYAKASAHITSFRVTGTDARGGTATVTARIVQGGSSYSARFTTVRERGLPWLAAWRLAPQQLPQLAIAVAGPPSVPVTVAGVTLPAHANADTGTDAMTESVLPGTYSVAAVSGTDYGAAPQTVTVRLGRPTAPVRLDIRLTAAGQAAVQASAALWLGECAASTELAPVGCPFRALPTPGIAYSNGRWSITVQPTVVVGGWNAAAGGWQVGTSVPGSVTFTAHAAQGDESGTASTGPRPFTVAGTAVPSGGGVTFVPSPSYSAGAAGSA